MKLTQWTRAALHRSAKTIAQTAVALIPADIAIDAVDWRTVLGSSLLAGVLSLLTSVATDLPEVE